MAMETLAAADGNIEIMFLRQIGDDPFTPTPERTAQISEVAGRKEAEWLIRRQKPASAARA